MTDAPEYSDLDDDPEWDQMRELGRVVGKVARHLLAGQPLTKVSDVLEPEEHYLIPSALVVLKEIKRAGAITLGEIPGTLLIQPARIGRA